jgi:hypothetical protein
MMHYLTGRGRLLLTFSVEETEIKTPSFYLNNDFLIIDYQLFKK